MKKLMMLLIGLLFCYAGSAQTLTINTPGANWTLLAPSTLLTAAGTNYTHVETTALNHTLMKVNATLVWSVSVQQSSTSNWDTGLKLFIRRSGDGTGGALLTGNTNYIQLTSTAQPLVGGLLGLGFSRDDIPIQYKIEGISVLLPVKTYSTTILFTVSGL
ncbi:hypothetical protein DSL64_26660 [Dyadobacter luteus]|uniref:Uncharacterized protein n=1 Tax=Dyadobacter luteus TaxID=2259619 RepID=A0A3D8Y3L2_9BACT|nr:hypothetical protein [Dyadobacter luteus]REA56503.1 hypothetical protein DSL64_26660 [Dyadobacter luteus]